MRTPSRILAPSLALALAGALAARADRPAAAEGGLAEILGGAWSITMTANYSSCDDVRVGDVRKVEWQIRPKGAAEFAVVEKGGKKGDPTAYVGEITRGAPPVVMFRAKKQAGAELRVEDDQLVGRVVMAKPKGPCAVVYDAVATRTSPPMVVELGDRDPEDGDFTLDEALAGLPGSGKLMADLETPLGTITCELFPKEAPRTTASFVGLARGRRAFRDPDTGKWVRGRRFYDGLAFHRVIPSFMIQGGDPLSLNYADPRVGTGNPGFTLPDESQFSYHLFDEPGRLAMAHAGIGTAGSQFFITETPSAPHLDRRGYTIFGQCGPLDVIRKIARVPRDTRDKPNDPVTMKIRIYRQ